MNEKRSTTQGDNVECKKCSFYRSLYNDLYEQRNCADLSNLDGQGKYIISADEKNKGQNCEHFKRAGLIRQIITDLDLIAIDVRVK